MHLKHKKKQTHNVFLAKTNIKLQNSGLVTFYNMAGSGACCFCNLGAWHRAVRTARK